MSAVDGTHADILAAKSPAELKVLVGSLPVPAGTIPSVQERATEGRAGDRREAELPAEAAPLDIAWQYGKYAAFRGGGAAASKRRREPLDLAGSVRACLAASPAITTWASSAVGLWSLASLHDVERVAAAIRTRDRRSRTLLDVDARLWGLSGAPAGRALLRAVAALATAAAATGSVVLVVARATADRRREAGVVGAEHRCAVVLRAQAFADDADSGAAPWQGSHAVEEAFPGATGLVHIARAEHVKGFVPESMLATRTRSRLKVERMHMQPEGSRAQVGGGAETAKAARTAEATVRPRHGLGCAGGGGGGQSPLDF